MLPKCFVVIENQFKDNTDLKIDEYYYDYHNEWDEI